MRGVLQGAEERKCDDGGDPGVVLHKRPFMPLQHSVKRNNLEGCH